MKKFVSIIAVLLILSLVACSNQDTPPTTDNSSNTQSENITMLDEGVWPMNEYTEGLPVPSGTVAWAMLDTEHENCGISIVDIAESDYHDYMKLLEQEGFSVIEDVSEEIKGQDYVSIGTLLSNGEKGLVITENEDNIFEPIVLDFRNNNLHDLSDPSVKQTVEIADVMKTMDNRIKLDKSLLEEYQAN